MRRFISLPTVACALVTGAFGAPVMAQTKAPAPAAIAAPKTPAINELDCRTLLRLNGDERAYTLLYLHGFVSGKTNQLLLPAEELAAATDRIVDHCIDKPSDKLLPVFEQVRKAR
jgi:hypothetical protein